MKVFVITMKSAPTLRSIVALALLVTEEPRTPPAATSASPTMRADAVAAVRRGLRRAFSRESRPVVPQIRGSGRPMAATAGRLANGLSTATPRKTSSAPMPTQRMPASASRPAAMLAMPKPRTAAADQSAATQGRLGQGDVVAQRRDRRDLGGPTGRADRRHDGDDDADQEGPHHRVGLQDQTARRDVTDERADDSPKADGQEHTEPEAEYRAEEADGGRLGDDRTVHLAAARPERAQQSELAAALRDQHRERVEDDERADEDRDDGEDEQEDAEELQLVLDVARVGSRKRFAGQRFVVSRQRLRRPGRARLRRSRCRRRPRGPPRSCRRWRARPSLWRRRTSVIVAPRQAGALAEADDAD